MTACFGDAVRTASARPVDVLLNVLQMGSRSDLGLGGDPFLSVVGGESGWWLPDSFNGRPSVLLEHRQVAPITNRLTGGSASLTQSTSEVTVQHGWGMGPRHVQTALAATWGQARHRLDGELSSLGLEERGVFSRGLVKADGIVPGLRVQAEVPLGHGGSRMEDSPLRYGIHYRIANRLVLAGHRSLVDYAPVVNADVDAERARIPLNLTAREWDYGARLLPWRSLSLEWRVWEAEARPGAALTDALEDHFMPGGYAVLREYEAGWGRTDGSRVTVRRSQLRLTPGGTAYWGGDRYALVSHSWLEATTWLLALQVPVRGTGRVVADLSHTDFDGFGRVKVEGWRFSSWETAWINGSRISEIDAEGAWDRLHLGYEHCRGTPGFQCGLSWYEARPRATVHSWTKVVLGRSDEEFSGLSSNRYSLGAVSLGGSLGWGAVRLTGALHQFVFADDHVNPAAPSGEPPGEAGRPPGWFGGTFAEVSIGYSP